MAGNGRGAQKSKNPILKAPESPMGLEFPAVRPDGQEWLPRTRAWYESIRISPLAQRMGVS